MKTIKLMADYQCHPLWEASPGEVGNIAPHTLPISSVLQAKLIEWAKKFDSTLNMDDPLSSGFRSAQEAENFKKDGNDLAEQLRNELVGQYMVIYKSTSIGASRH